MDQTIQFTVRPYTELEPEILQILEKNTDEYIRKNGTIYFRDGNLVYSAKDSMETENLLEVLHKKGFSEENKTEEQVWMNVLQGDVSKSDLAAYGIQDGFSRCVIVFRPLQNSGKRLQREMIPLEPADRITETQNGETVLILNMKKRLPEEIYEFAAAAIETMESEGGYSCLAGIGNTAEDIRSLSRSYQEAKSAIETGIRHKITGRVYAWDRLTLERLTDLIPQKDAEAFHKELIGPQAEKVLTDEILETIHSFFLNDLNLSTTARKLYIHRNTLLYRMEKIRKVTGLDLRKFEDAVVFRILMNMND